MRYTVTQQRVDIIGEIWQGFTCAQSYSLTNGDLAAIGAVRDRAAVAAWIHANRANRFGDFAHIADFRADFTLDLDDGASVDVAHEWADDASAGTFADCMEGAF